MSGLVSIIMPSFNTADYIEESIRSVLNQTYVNWELIIVDDCSSDGTDAIVRSFLSDNRIKYRRNEKNSGAAVSRNLALREAKGKWIAFLDSDDLWSPIKLERQVSFMEENGICFSYTNYYEIDLNGEKNGFYVSGPRRITRTGFYNYCWPGCLTVMYDRTTVGLIQAKDIKKNNDYAMWLKICKVSDCYLLNESLALYRKGREGSISTHSITSLVKWHYQLFRYCENQTVLISAINTARNVLFGLFKKAYYRRKN